MNEITIGVLAGMGPRSTAPFVDLLMTECQKQYGARQNADFPPVFIYSLPTPFHVDRPVDHELVQQTIIAGLRRLEDVGVAFIAMPCNSAHAYFDRLASSVGVPLLNMAEEALTTLGGCERVALLGTVTTVSCGIYQRGILAAGKQCIHSGKVQSLVTEIIAGIIAGDDRAGLRARWDEVLALSVRAGADSIMVACTELNALGDLNGGTLKVADATIALASATIRKYLACSGRQKPEPGRART